MDKTANSYRALLVTPIFSLLKTTTKLLCLEQMHTLVDSIHSIAHMEHKPSLISTLQERKKGLIPPDYMVWWGFEDNKLYEYAKSEMTRLYNEGKPFCFMMENADTHFPDGFKEPETKDIFGNQYANVIFHSQKQVADLIRWKIGRAHV